MSKQVIVGHENKTAKKYSSKISSGYEFGKEPINLPSPIKSKDLGLNKVFRFRGYSIAFWGCLRFKLKYFILSYFLGLMEDLYVI